MLAAVGLLSVFYFVFAEFMIGSLCPLCTIIHILVATTFFLALHQFREGVYGVTSVTMVADIAGNRILFLIAAAVVVLLPVVLFNLPAMHPKYDPTDVQALASCLTARGVKMYGTASCSHCVAQKGLFGESFAKIVFIDCQAVSLFVFCDATRALTLVFKEAKQCEDAKITGYPTWDRGSEAGRLKGTAALKELSAWAGCTLK